MVKVVDRIRRRFHPLCFSYSTKITGSLVQEYASDTQEFIPDRRLVPADVLIEIRVKDKKGNISHDIINKYLTDLRWYTGSIADENNILDNNSDFLIDKGETNTRGKITVRRNADIGNDLILIFSAKYSDPRNGDVYHVTGNVSFSAIPSVAEPLRVKVAYPFGQIVDPVEEFDHLEIDNVLFLGENEASDAFYSWQKKSGSNYENLIEGQDGIRGVLSSKLKIPCGVVGERVDLRCMADRMPDLVGVNLISKIMISDNWNSITEGICIPGEDADGKYFAIDQSALYYAFNKSVDDIFGGRIKYKLEQRYRLSVKWKLGGTQSQDGIMLYVIYTDGTNERIRILKDQTTIQVVHLLTAEGKTIKKITETFGTATYKSHIYDIALYEYYGALCISANGVYTRIPQNGVATGNSWGAFPISKEIADTLVPGTNVTLSIENVKILAGSASNLTINLYTGTNAITGISLLLSTLKRTITIPEKADATSPRLLVCGGTYNNMVGNAVELRGVMLVVGETAYKYCPAEEEFLPALPDGAPRPMLSEKAITTNHVLSTQYPSFKLKTMGGGMVEEDARMVQVGVVLGSNQGDIMKPEKFWSFVWKDKMDAIFNRGSKILIPSERFENEDFEYTVESIEGLSEAKYAACFDGVDDFLHNTNPSGIYPWGYGGVRIHVVEFVIDNVGKIQHIVELSYCQQSENKVFGFQLSIVPDGRIQYRVGREAGAIDVPKVYYGTRRLEPGKLYQVEVIIALNGSYSSKINGVTDTFNGTGGAEYTTSRVRIGLGASGTYFSGKVLRYIVHNEDKSTYNEWDFQPTGGDRASMLKNKEVDGNVKGTSNLTPANIGNIDNQDPEGGFFQPV